MRTWTRVRAVGRTDLRRRWRRTQDRPAQLLALAVAGLFFLPMGLFGLLGLFAFGAGVASGDVDAPVAWSRTGLVYGWIGVAAFAGYRAYATVLRPDTLDAHLATVSHRELLGGLAYAEALLWVAPALAAAVLGSLAFAAGAGSPVAVPAVLVAAGLLVASAAPVGFAVALVVRNAGVRSVLLARLRLAFFALLGIGYLWVVATASFDSVLGPLHDLLAPTPVGWYGDLALAGTAPEASPVLAVGAVGFTAIVVVASVPALSRLVEWLWYADGVSIEPDDGGARVDRPSDGAGRSRLARLASAPIAGVLGAIPRPMLGVVRVDLKRARRSPLSLSYAIYSVFVLFNPVVSSVQSGSVSPALAPLVVLSGAWTAGVLFTLNVVGNEGAALPATVLGESAGRRLVGGHVLAGALVGVPLAVVPTAVIGLLGHHSLAFAASLALTALLLAACAPPIATGIGAALPRYEAVRVSRRTRAIVPSLPAFAIYSVAVGLLATPALLAHTSLVGVRVASALGTSHAAIALLAALGSGAVAAVAGWLSVRYAVRSVETFEFE